MHQHNLGAKDTLQQSLAVRQRKTSVLHIIENIPFKTGAAMSIIPLRKSFHRNEGTLAFPQYPRSEIKSVLQRLEYIDAVVEVSFYNRTIAC